MRALSMLCLTALWAPVLPAAPRQGDKPNILFIAIDDQNDWTGILRGHPQARTPNMDALAARGMLFTHAYCAAPACNPSRAALMTGIRPSTSGVYHNPQPWRKSPVLKDAVTLTQHFMAHGYRAIGSGKIFHGAYPDPASWNEYWPSQTKNRPGDPAPPHTPLNGIPRTGHFDWGPIDVRPEEMGDWQVADWVAQQLQRRYRQPFFLACGIFRPHLPWYVPRKYFDMFPLESVELPKVREDDLNDVPAAGVRIAKPQGDHRKVVEHHQWRRAVQSYLASIAFADDCLGHLIEALDRSPYAKNTIVVLWTDHGWHLGEKQHWRKFALWEEATRTPLIFIVPGITRPGQVCSRPVSLIDIYPTLVDLCGLPARKEVEGVSLTPLLRNPIALWDRPALTTHGRNNHALRSERWRYIRYADGSEELYDHRLDEYEWVNLARDPQCEGVKRELARWLPALNAPASEYDRSKRNPKKKTKK